MNFNFNKADAGHKIRLSLSLGVLSGVLIGAGRAAWFVIDEQYTMAELREFWPEFLITQLNSALLLCLSAAIVFALLWILIDRVANIGLALLVVGLPCVPLAYYLNREFFPGLREVKSLVGNGFIVLLFALSFWLVFAKWTSRWKLRGRILNRGGLLILAVAAMGVYGFYYARPHFSRLAPSPRAGGKEFFDMLNLESDGLSAVHAAAQSEDYVAARAALLNHLHLRLPKHRARLEQIIDGADSTAVIAKADSTLRRSFTFWGVHRELPQRIDWRKNPTKDRVWLFALNQQKWLAEVSQAYALTHDEKYAKDFAKILESWFQQNEMPRWKNERDPVWRLMETGIRGVNWLDALFVFLSSPSLSDDLKLRLLASLHDHAQFLYHFRSPQRNHLLRESYSMLQIGVLLPEFKMSASWKKIAVARLARAVEEDVYADGGYSEGSTYYHRFAMRVLQEIKDFAETNDVVLPPVIAQRLEGMYEFLMYVARPDGTMPQINDGFYSRDLRESFAAPARKLARRDFEYFNTAGASGEPPRYTSRGFPNSGIYAMRSDWTDSARYCVIDAGLYGSAHGHEDKLSFELHAFGCPFIIEAGTYTYVYNEWHKYFESSFSHNTIVIDGKGQFRQAEEAKWTHRSNEPLPNIWVSTKDFDYLAAEYDDGYGDKKEGVDRSLRHERRMLFVKPDYWVLWDIVSSSDGAKEGETGKNGAGAHRSDQFFHFAPMDVEIFAEEKLVRAKKAAGPNLLIYSLLPEKVEMKKIHGQLDPIQGWISPTYGKREPAPAIVYSQVSSAPAIFLNALIPTGEGYSSHPEVVSIPVTMNSRPLDASEAVAIHLTGVEWSDFVLMAPKSSGEKSFGNFSTQQQLYFRRLSKSGETMRQFESNLQPEESH